MQVRKEKLVGRNNQHFKHPMCICHAYKCVWVQLLNIFLSACVRVKGLFKKLYMSPYLSVSENGENGSFRTIAVPGITWLLKC